MSEVGVIHEDCSGFGDGLGFNVLNESEKERVSKASTQQSNNPQEPTKNDK